MAIGELYDEAHPSAAVLACRGEALVDAAITLVAAGVAVVRESGGHGVDMGFGPFTVLVVVVMLLVGSVNIGLGDVVWMPADARSEAPTQQAARLVLRAARWLLFVGVALFVLQDRGSAAVGMTTGAAFSLGRLAAVVRYERREGVRLFRLPARRWTPGWLRQRPLAIYARPSAST